MFSAKEVTLTLRKIYIVPTLLSVAMLLLCGLLFVLAVNFQNSLIYGVSFWLFSLLIISIFFTYRNISGLSIRAINAEPCFAKGKAEFEVEVSNSSSYEKRALQLGWKDEDSLFFDIKAQQTLRIKLSHTVQQRGHFPFPVLLINTRYPIGLTIAWSYLLLDLRSIVYPKPLSLDNLEKPAVSCSDYIEKNAGIEVGQGMTDFGGIRAYQHGDSPRHIHWIKYAQTGRLYSKTFIDYANDECWLDWDRLSIKGTEERLSYLCYQILLLHREKQSYGLKLPTQIVQPAQGEAHKAMCLSALAFYEIKE